MTGHPSTWRPSTGHPTPETLATSELTPKEREHAASCASCQEEMAAWQNLADAARTAFDTPAPRYEALLGRYRLGERTPLPPPLGLRRSIRLVAALTVAQCRLLPRSLAATTVLGLAATTVLAAMSHDETIGQTVFGLGVSLVFQLGALTACAARTDPRLELTTTMPVSPAVVFAARIVIVLAADVLLSWAASGLAIAAGLPATLPDLVAGWFGQAMLAASVGVVAAVRWSPTTGAGASAAAWIAAVATAVPGFGVGFGLLERTGHLLEPLTTTNPLNLTLSLALLTVAVLTMHHGTEPGHETT